MTNDVARLTVQAREAQRKIKELDKFLVGLEKRTNKLNVAFDKLGRNRGISGLVRELGRAESAIDRVSRAIRNIPTRKTTSISVTAKGVGAVSRDINNAARNRSATITGKAAIETARARLDNLTKTRTALINARVVETPGTVSPRAAPTAVVPVGPRRSNARIASAAVTASIGFEAAAALRSMTRAATDAAFEMQRLETLLQTLPLTDDERSFAREAGQLLSTETPTLPETRTQEIATDVVTTIGQTDTTEEIARIMARNEAALRILLGPERAREATAVSLKALDNAGVTDDAEAAANILNTVAESAALLGETFKPLALLTALRTSGGAAGLSQSPEGFISFAAAVDDQGPKAGFSVARFLKVLRTPLESAGAGGGVAEGTVEKLIESGLRNADGLLNEQAAEIAADPFKFIIDEIKPLLSGKALADKTGGIIQKELANLGFVGRDQRFVLNQLQNEDEITRKREQAAALDLEVVQANASDNLRVQLDAVAAQFQNLSNDALVPLFETLAPGAETLADFLNKLANSDSTFAKFAAGVAAATGPLATFAAMNADLILLGAAAKGHMTAARQLQTAAVSLGAPGAAIPVAGKGKPAVATITRTPRKLTITDAAITVATGMIVANELVPEDSPARDGVAGFLDSAKETLSNAVDELAEVVFDGARFLDFEGLMNDPGGTLVDSLGFQLETFASMGANTSNIPQDEEFWRDFNRQIARTADEDAVLSQSLDVDPINTQAGRETEVMLMPVQIDGGVDMPPAMQQAAIDTAALLANLEANGQTRAVEPEQAARIQSMLDRNDEARNAVTAADGTPAIDGSAGGDLLEMDLTPLTTQIDTLVAQGPALQQADASAVNVAGQETVAAINAQTGAINAQTIAIVQAIGTIPAARAPTPANANAPAPAVGPTTLE